MRAAATPYNINDIVSDLAGNLSVSCETCAPVMSQPVKKNTPSQEQKKQWKKAMDVAVCKAWVERNMTVVPTCKYGIGERMQETVNMERSRVVKGGRKMKKSISIEALKGRLTPFEESVKIMTFFWISVLFETYGELPETIEIPMSDYPKMLNMKKSGGLYERIRVAISKLEAMHIIHDHFLVTKDENGKQQYYTQESSALVNNVSYTRMRSVSRDGNLSYEKAYITFQLPPLLRYNIENGVTEEIDLKRYISLRQGRTRGLFMILEHIRYETQKTLYLHDLYEKLSLLGYRQEKQRRGQLRILLGRLVASGYLTDFEFSNDKSKVHVRFSELKERKQKTREEKQHNAGGVLRDLEEENTKGALYGTSKMRVKGVALLHEKPLVVRMAREVEIDIAYARTIEEKLPEGAIIGALEDLHWRMEHGKIIKSVGACFTHVLREKCAAYGVFFPFGDGKKNRDRERKVS